MDVPKGSGTRKGNGACLCDSGTTGETCSECAHGHFLSYKDGDKTLCSPCHHSCTGDCSGPEPKKCFACKEGFIMHAEHGCQDIDECQASGGKVCETNQFCMNLGQDHLFTTLAYYQCSVTAWHFFVTGERNFVSQQSPILEILIGPAKTFL